MAGKQDHLGGGPLLHDDLEGGDAVHIGHLHIHDDDGKRLFAHGFHGLQAVEAMREQPFPIVVMDVKMPNMDGIAALKIIVEQWPTAQVILLSGHADMQLAVQAMSEGAFGYLMKPVDFDELLFKIEDAAMQSRLEGPESDMAR